MVDKPESQLSKLLKGTRSSELTAKQIENAREAFDLAMAALLVRLKPDRTEAKKGRTRDMTIIQALGLFLKIQADERKFQVERETLRIRMAEAIQKGTFAQEGSRADALELMAEIGQRISEMDPAVIRALNLMDLGAIEAADVIQAAEAVRRGGDD